ncbi:MAG: uracil-DNA glycosylase family protein [Prevotella sp.]|nr:uracil-DNA glycosylase family protein [Prevotella sp.]
MVIATTCQWLFISSNDFMCDVEYHPLKPFLPENTRLLMLGSFPPARQRWCMDFFYPNFINDMWRIFGIVFFHNKEYFVDNGARKFRRDKIISFLTEKGIALYDTACAVRRTKNTASDKDLEIVETTDIKALLLNVPSCVSVVTTGQKATEVMCSCFNIPSPKVGECATFSFEGREMQHFRMPSSSRAYPMNIEKKAEYYRRMFCSLNFLDNK